MPAADDHTAHAAAHVAAIVVARERLGSLLWLTVEAPGWSSAAPGQFALLQAVHSACFLPRAFSVAAQQGGRVSFLIAPIGMGTQELDGLRSGDSVWVTGPLGNGFDMTGLLAPAAPPASAASAGPAAPRLVVVAGGVGAAPFSLMLDALVDPAAKSHLEILVLLGFRDAAQARGAEPVDSAAARVTAAGAVCVVEVATEDGSRGPKRLVTELLAARVRPGDRVVVCGPRPMLDAVWRVCNKVGVESASFSLETGMACGVGSCHGCAVTLADGSIARVCHDGPVFTGAAIFGREEV